MTCLCVKLTGGWTSTLILLMTSPLLFWRPWTLVLLPCSLQPLSTPMVVALALQNTPEPLGVPLRVALPGVLVYQKGSPVDTRHSLVFFSLSSLGDFEIRSHCSLRNLARPGPVPVVVGECCAVIYRQVATFLTARWRFVPLKTLSREGGWW